MKRIIPISIVLLGAILLSACATSSRGVSWPGLAVDTTNVYFADGASVFAIRLSDGSVAWKYPKNSVGSVFYSSPVVTSDGQVLVGSAGIDHALYSLDAATGNEKWPTPFKAATDHFIASPLVVNDTVYAPNNDGMLYVLKLATGQQLWALPVSHSLWGTPVSNGKFVFVTSLDHFLYAIDPESRKIAWKVDLGGAIPGSPAISPDGTTVYIGSFNSKVAALNAEDGAIRWTADTQGWVWGAPALEGDSVYVADINGNIYSLGVPNGKNPWPSIQPDGPITGSPLALGDGVLVATESGGVYTFDTNGGMLWPNGTQVGGKIYTTPVAAGDMILVAPLNTDFLLAALNRETGSIIWKFTGK
jgi:outer membrane protein assembly factor BamB